MPVRCRNVIIVDSSKESFSIHMILSIRCPFGIYNILIQSTIISNIAMVFSKGETTNELAAELELNYLTVLTLRREIQKNAEHLQPDTPIPDLEAESDELFQNAGEKRSTARQSTKTASATRQQTAWARHLCQ